MRVRRYPGRASGQTGDPRRVDRLRRARQQREEGGQGRPLPVRFPKASSLTISSGTSRILRSVIKTGRPPAVPPLEEAVRCPLLDRNPEGWLRCCTARFLPVARRVAGDDATARDALQESWIIVLEKLCQYRGESPACGWVGTIVRHEAGRRAASRNREAPLPPGEPGSATAGPDETLQRRQLVRVLLEAIDHLPPTYADVVRLRDLDERPVAEVARELRISRSNVAVRLHRAHKLLRRHLLLALRPHRETCNRTLPRTL